MLSVKFICGLSSGRVSRVYILHHKGKWFCDKKETSLFLAHFGTGKGLSGKGGVRSAECGVRSAECGK